MWCLCHTLQLRINLRAVLLRLLEKPWLGDLNGQLTPVSACVRRPLSGCGRSIRWISCTAFAALATAGARCSRAAAQSLRETGAVLLGGHMELEAFYPVGLKVVPPPRNGS